MQELLIIVAVCLACFTHRKLFSPNTGAANLLFGLCLCLLPFCDFCLFNLSSLFESPVAATLPARLLNFYEAAAQHNHEVHCHVEETCSDVVEAELVPSFWLGHKVSEAEQKVSQHEYCDLVERFHVVHEVRSERSVPLQVYAH